MASRTAEMLHRGAFLCFCDSKADTKALPLELKKENPSSYVVETEVRLDWNDPSPKSHLVWRTCIMDSGSIGFVLICAARYFL